MNVSTSIIRNIEENTRKAQCLTRDQLVAKMQTINVIFRRLLELGENKPAAAPARRVFLLPDAP